MVDIITDEGASMEALNGKTVAVIGYGAQGKAQALCMRDSGVSVILGLRENGSSWGKAKEDGFEVMNVADASRKADIIHILIPDEIQAEVYDNDIKEHMKEGKTLSFSHGFNIVFNKIVPSKDIDVIMVAPKAPGTEERKRYVEGFGVPGLIAINNDASGKAKDTALAMSKSMGFTKAGVMQCTFEQEACEDLFGEQAVLCGGAAELVKAGFETLTEAGYPPEVAYFECLHELKLIVDLMYEGGLTRMWDVVSNTAEYGGRTRGKRIINEESKKVMKEILDEVETGKFADEWLSEHKAGLPNLSKMREEEKTHPIEVVGKRVRALFQKN